MFVLPIEIISFFLNLKPFSQSGVATYGDIMQFFIFFILIFLIIKKDKLGILQLFISSIIALGIMLLLKHYFSTTLRFYHENIARISQRPDVLSDFDGFPSGHTTAAFIACGFIWAKFGVKFGLIAFIFAAFVGLSRIYVMRHTTLQVICGAILGFFTAFIVVKKLTFKQKSSTQNLTKKEKNAEN
ncbi:phosphatase PAP2 family protein [Helicobacter saguini]|uniref:Phosphatase PAP2 family protein n=1 Tax=Helicobacter saguini TaxID=1548018 RepID=A0A347VR55_9HELI|nr:phosphatase PAP2 family protein [Helicobacter saguini]MWV63028.1 phosphatase PAP2 family protein [Helicobacter saguini]MWV66303.1 phosphatase PAP2 family protein [Helicobacter saguini]MWV68655.1 phosphatase PAP2 family protein [Helicobacter saguini]MWV71794.1 phosphatase PAP2 family protein [Helicobacter saguini]TLD95822.1 phosphatase PAP2 family protein [Helicobacter saguini]